MERNNQKKFYFTYGSAHWPGGGWTVVFAKDRHEAEEKFCRKHPRNEYGQLVCCWIYDDEEFKKTCMYKNGNLGKRCVEIIGLEVAG